MVARYDSESFFFFDENEKVTTFKHFWPAQKVPI